MVVVVWWTNRRHHTRRTDARRARARRHEPAEARQERPDLPALTRRRPGRPEHSTLIGSNLNSDMRDYTRFMLFAEEHGANFTAKAGRRLRRRCSATCGIPGDPARFQAYVRYYLSDHRPYSAESPRPTRNVACPDPELSWHGRSRRCRRPWVSPSATCRRAAKLHSGRARRDGHSHDPARRQLRHVRDAPGRRAYLIDSVFREQRGRRGERVRSRSGSRITDGDTGRGLPRANAMSECIRRWPWSWPERRRCGRHVRGRRGRIAPALPGKMVTHARRDRARPAPCSASVPDGRSRAHWATDDSGHDGRAVERSSTSTSSSRCSVRNERPTMRASSGRR